MRCSRSALNWHCLLDREGRFGDGGVLLLFLLPSITFVFRVLFYGFFRRFGVEERLSFLVVRLLFCFR